MSIIPLQHLTLIGHASRKAETLRELQKLGCLHILPLAASAETPAAGPGHDAREALAYLQAIPFRRRQVQDPEDFDAAAVEKRALEIKSTVRDLEIERDGLIQRIAEMRPWGDFEFPALDQIAPQRLWFYLLPTVSRAALSALKLPWKLIKQDRAFLYIVIISPQEPEPDLLPVPRTHLGARSRRELSKRLEEVETTLDDLQAERRSLSRWCKLLAQSSTRLENEAELRRAGAMTRETEPLFALQAWFPARSLEAIQALAEQKGLVLQTRPPSSEDKPPTLMENTGVAACGQDLVSFYLTPAYHLWDPSRLVFFSFVIFFAMILADAGYSAFLGLLLAWKWKAMGASPGSRRFRTLSTWLISAGLIYGVMVASYFGVTPAQGTFLRSLQVLDLGQSMKMMLLSVVIGVVHLAIANIMDAKRQGWVRAGLASLGWAMAIVGGLFWGLGGTKLSPGPWLERFGLPLLVFGLVFVVFFLNPSLPWYRRLGTGIMGLTKVTSAFGDVLSYLRLFALGLASSSLALAFNGLATDAGQGIPIFGIVITVAILLFGHVLNLILGLMGAGVHGLRLNFIEFFNWGITEEGYAFRAFKYKEDLWNPSS
jgi:V/A-type H+/Na+-transporting ATPase subunit I